MVKNMATHVACKCNCCMAIKVSAFKNTCRVPVSVGKARVQLLLCYIYERRKSKTQARLVFLWQDDMFLQTPFLNISELTWRQLSECSM
jgi:hypothetical protein